MWRRVWSVGVRVGASGGVGLGVGPGAMASLGAGVGVGVGLELAWVSGLVWVPVWASADGAEPGIGLVGGLGAGVGLGVAPPPFGPSAVARRRQTVIALATELGVAPVGAVGRNRTGSRVGHGVAGGAGVGLGLASGS